MAKTKPPAKDVEVLPALPEQQLATTDGQSIVSFITGLVPFFQHAATLETKARNTLATAKAFTLPKPGDMDGDAELQRFIRDASAQKKAVEKQWEITSIIHGFHKKLVAARSRSTDMLDEASQTAQRLHNTFKDAAERAARAEEDRLRREAEVAAQQARQRELDALEQAAVEAEAASTDLSVREVDFVNRIMNGGNPPTVAARNAGYKDPEKAGARLMATPKIMAACDAIKAASEIRRQAAAVAEKPLDVATVEPIKSGVEKVGTDRNTHSAEITDERALIEAVIGGRHGIPTDILMVNPAKLNDYARSMHELINRWPGARYKKTTKTV